MTPGLTLHYNRRGDTRPQSTPRFIRKVRGLLSGQDQDPVTSTAGLSSPSRLGSALRWVLAAVVLGLVCSALCRPGGPLYLLELKTLDLRFRYRTEVYAPQHVAVVAIDERSINDPRLGRWPWPRQAHARLLRNLQAEKPRAIAFDVIFAEPSSIADDAAFVAACRAGGNVFLSLYEGQLRTRSRGAGAPESFAVQPGLIAQRHRIPVASAMVAPQAALTGVAAGGGVIVAVPDPDGIMRRSLLFVQEHTREATYLYPTMTLALAARFLGLRWEDMQFDMTRMARLSAERQVPLDPDGRALINYLGPPGTVKPISYVDVLDRRFSRGAFRDKIVLIGSTAEGMVDQHPTPLGSPMAGVEIQAQALESLLQGRTFKPARDWDALATTLALAAIAALAGLWLRPGLGLAFVALMLVAYNVTSLRGFTEQGLIWPGLAPNMAAALGFVGVAVYRLMTEEAGRKRLRDEFGRYAPPQVVARLDAGEMRERAAGVKRPVTALFADVRGFTAWSATADPHDVIRVLNTLIESVTQLAFEAEGAVDNVVGDEVFVTFNAVQDQADHTRRAVDLAINITAALDGLNERWLSQGVLPAPLRIGIGIHTGEALVGRLGSHLRTQYTALGQTVNLAARLQSLNKELGTTILCTREVATQLSEQIEVRHRGLQDIPGHPVQVEVYEIVGRRPGNTRGGTAAGPA